MKENIVIPIKIERVKLWTRWTMEATWMICLSLLATSGGVAIVGALVWIASESEIILTLGLSSISSTQSSMVVLGVGHGGAAVYDFDFGEDADVAVTCLCHGLQVGCFHDRLIFPCLLAKEIGKPHGTEESAFLTSGDVIV